MNNYNSTAESGQTNLSELEQLGRFELVPSDKVYDFEDKSRFTKLSLSEPQKMHISAAYQHLPAMAATGTLAQAYVARFPEGLPHTLTALKQGGFGSMIQGEQGFVGSASFFPIAGQAIFLGAFTAMAVASGQYFLAKINSQLDVIQRGVDEILDFLYGDKKAELMSEISFAKYAFENYTSIMAHESQRTATLVGLQSAKKVAMSDIEFYIQDLSSTVESPEKDLNKVLGQFTRNYTQTVKRAADNKRRYAPGEGSIPPVLLSGGFQRGAPFGTRLCLQSVVCYTCWRG